MRQLYIITSAIFVWVFLYGLLFVLLQQVGALEALRVGLPSAVPWLLLLAGVVPVVGSGIANARATAASDPRGLVRLVVISAALAEFPSMLGFLGSVLTSAPVFIALGVGLSLVAFVAIAAYMPAFARRVTELTANDGGSPAEGEA
ncbi:MAG: hypothetical protein N2512_06445 [Armatimonadetes bacterium]|nr:hypothetical protein [Armatimonadota bacterium]